MNIYNLKTVEENFSCNSRNVTEISILQNFNGIQLFMHILITITIKQHIQSKYYFKKGRKREHFAYTNKTPVTSNKI